MDVLPERVAALDQRLEQIVGGLPASLAPGGPRARRADVRRQILHAHHRSRRQRHGLFDDVLQLADVARPAIGLKQAQGLVAERRRATGGREDVGDERRDVLDPVAQRRHVQVHDPQPIEQVLAKQPGRHELVEIAVGGRHDARVDANRRAVAADRLHFPVLEHAEQQRLHAQAHLTGFVEEERAAVRRLQLAGSIAIRAGEAAADMPEQLGLEQRLGEAGAVDRDEGTVAPGRVLRGWCGRRDPCRRRSHR